ncbi:MAG: hypothetical protein A2600_12560 [Candidatus Lambdaproteobacteria bacterium RIFOXYD1_FULL_56_27]|uniref:Uncharacterized protein n=1 Tax=Candidatus Lambdaproteobacteria bacterium RIFOXYD2_FULL_56_26 TaxID=1817773 RepID=A0A1F6GSS5_9PROT|nr:MAG: hypothetical protein A2426_07235 [Candidatus Lambdaproteobacteria bacterium RIFOXYC1_FULL_56_13]OGH01212.1 MAG: hypothetical protein A2557_00960 [Candidatus Lambdaproteobacteria bacterium RIFOXYD2_FULL_56_26]OGH06479.1 MAG: hypothetical protein A2600_12560 [Candidatus Lambdaproteobacteria bacterium RIFOXYD1_FULL_56_27]
MKLNKKVWLPALVLVGALGLGAGFVLAKRPPKQLAKPPSKVPLVRVLVLNPQKVQAKVEAYAATEAAKELTLSPRVAGRVSAVAPGMVPGGYVAEGALLFELDPQDLKLKLDQAKAVLAKAEYDLDTAKAQQKSAQEGIAAYNRVARGKQSKASPLALFAPQIKNAQAGLASAQASVAQAELDLSRTKVLAPFSGYVRSTTLAEGQNLSTASQVATIFAATPIRLKVSLTLSDLGWLQSKAEDGQGSPVLLSKAIGPQTHHWKGVVARRLPEIDAMGRLAQVMVEVEEPHSDLGFVLPMGLVVKVEIEGKELEEVYELPLYALKAEDQAWFVNPQGQLETRSLAVIRREGNLALVREGIIPGDRLVLTPLEAPVDGMELEVFLEPSPAEGPARKGQPQTLPSS